MKIYYLLILLVSFQQIFSKRTQDLLSKYLRNLERPTSPSTYITSASNAPRIINPVKSLAANLQSAQLNALHDFYNSTGGPFWIYFNVSETSQVWNWSASNPNPCADDWQGVTCQCKTSCVLTRLELDHHNLTGTIPATIGKLTSLTFLSLIHNNITGPLPKTIGELTKLSALSLTDNYLTGVIPGSLSNLTNLIDFNVLYNSFNRIEDEAFNLPSVVNFQIGLNYLTGTLPPTVANLVNCRLFTVVSNYLTSTLPPELFTLERIETLDLSYNNFNGTIPDGIGNLKNMTVFAANENFLEGTLPQSFGNLTELRILFLYDNYFFGSLPPAFGNLTHLRTLDLVANFFSQNLPQEFGSWGKLATLYIAENHFTGTFPMAIIKSKELNLIEIYGNFFVGHLADVMNHFHHMVYFDCGSNLFSGTLPFSRNWTNIYLFEGNVNYFTGTVTSQIANFSYLNYFDFGANYLHGTIPEALGTNHRLEYFNLSVNFLSGPLPEKLGNLDHLGQFSLYNNFLTGTMPSAYGEMRKVVIFSLYNNRFTGTIPSSFINLRLLQFFFIQQNSFTGPIANVLNYTAAPSLSNLDVSNNDFTGSIPENYFRLGNLSSFAVSANCLEGTVPDSICGVKSLTGVSMDGLTTSQSCRILIFPGSASFNSFISKRYIQGTIPFCLFSLPNLQSLHLSGNGFTGTIPHNLTISESLLDLSLSHNALHGTIPDTIQNRKWVNLSLAYNKFSGTISSDIQAIPSDGYIYLELNRLSGKIPSILEDTKTIQILEGNIFSCNRFETDLPRNDPESENYSCGSDTVDRMLIAYSAVAAFSVFCLILIIGWNYGVVPLRIRLYKDSVFSTLTKLRKWKEALRHVPVTEEGYNTCVNINNLAVFFSEIRRSFFIIAAFILVVLCPIYYYISVFSNSYTNEYAWGISALLLTGTIPAIALMIGFIALITLVFVVFNRLAAKTKGDVIFMEYSRASISDNVETSSNRARSASVYNFYCTTDARKYLAYAFIFLVNMIVMVVIDFCYVYIVLNFDLTTVIFTELGLALFKILLNNVLLWNSIPISYFIVSKFMKNTVESRPLSISVVHLIQRSYRYTVGDITFLEKIILYNNVIIPAMAIFIVSPDCFYYALFAAESVESTYTYVTCHRYLGTTSICEKNGYQAQTTSISYSPPFIYGYQCSSKIGINYVAVFIVMFIFVGIVIPLCKILLKSIYDKLPKNSKIKEYLHIIMPENLKELKPNNRNSQGFSFDTNADPSFSSASSLNLSPPIFQKLRLTAQINSYLAIMISFGGLFPPLAVIGAAAVISITYYEEYNFGRILTQARELGYAWYEEKLEDECANISKSVNLTLPPILFVTSLLFAYILFDTWGDEQGWRSALIPTFFMISLPFLLLIAQVASINYRQFTRKQKAKSIWAGRAAVTDDRELENSVEMIYGVNARDTMMTSDPSFANSVVGERPTVVVNPLGFIPAVKQIAIQQLMKPERDSEMVGGGGGGGDDDDNEYKHYFIRRDPNKTNRRTVGFADDEDDGSSDVASDKREEYKDRELPQVIRNQPSRDEENQQTNNNPPVVEDKEKATEEEQTTDDFHSEN